jgi:glycosidase
MRIYIYIALALIACNSEPKTDSNEVATELPSEWVQNATIYEVNLRHHTAEGNLAAFEKDLPRLKELGVDILWIMPLQPIGKLNRKAVGDTFVDDMPNPDYTKYWGSPYSISDYKAVNERYGNVEDFKRVVEKAHSLGMKVIMDWVANHTAWDNPWVTQHPDWYTKDSTGKITDPIGSDGKKWGWTDVADLNYDNREMRLAMIDALKFWVKECNVDGYRCDVAFEVPTDFWEEARVALDSVKPVFMLAEAEMHAPDLFNKAFDAYYGWEMHHVFNKLVKGETTTSEFSRIIAHHDSVTGGRAFAMNFIDSHDENAWNGTIEERLGDKWKPMAVMSYALPGAPMIYSGQEAGNNKRLKFFEKDDIDWNAPNAQSYFDFYKMLNNLKNDPAFSIRSPFQFDDEYENKDLVILDRGLEREYRIICNMSDKPWAVIGHEIYLTEGYNVVNQDKLEGEMLWPWGYIVLRKKK